MSSTAVPATMRAIVIKAFGGVEQLEIQTVSKPTIEASGSDVLIKVVAAALNRADVAQRSGHYAPPPGSSAILGLEVSGIVEQIGSQAHGVKIGDKVMALLTGGGYAEYAVTPAGCVMPIPEGYSFEEAASIPEAFITAWQALKLHGDLKAGQKVLIHAGASGVGVAAAQIVEKYFEATAVTTSSESKVDVCRNFASVALSRTPDENGQCFAPKVKAALGDNAIDLIIDPVFGGTYATENGQVLHRNGKIVVLALMGGATVQFNAAPYASKMIHIIFSLLRPQSPEYKAQLITTFREAVLPLFASRRMSTHVTQVFPWEQVAAAHTVMETNASDGKLVLRIADP